MSITPEQLAVLMADLNPQRVKHRSQGGANLSYLEAWDVKATLIRVFGFGGFSAEVIATEMLSKEKVEVGKDKKDGWAVAMSSTVRLTIHDTNAVYTETAVGSSTQPKLGEALDMAQKTASSDALKRAAIYLGTQFGLGLYDNGSTRDVIRRVFAEGQLWPTGEVDKLSPEQEKMLSESLGATVVESA